ncbi:MAG: hypothetical protein LAO24_04165 [Acidobacteriia bacterium]|nr:hypothetical protein [Terriglobia bacterium]
MSDTKWFEKMTGKFFSLFSQREVKTPLSFFFRIVTAFSAIVLAALLAVGPDPILRFKVFLTAVGFLAVLFVGVFLFAWIRPKHLVYGETGHRAEMKFAMGTEKKELAAGEIALTEGTTNPSTLAGEASPNVLPKAGGA